MRKETLMIYYAVLSVLFLISCDNNKSSNKYFPLKKGMTWEYNVRTSKPISTRQIEKGKKTAMNVGVREWKETITVEEEEMIEGKKYFKIVAVYSGLSGWDPSILYVRTADEGIYNMRKGSKEFLWLPFPIVDNKEWEYDLPHDTGENVTVKSVLKKTADIYIPGATYKDGLIITFVINTEGSGGSKLKSTNYYAANVGLVKKISYNETLDVSTEYILVKHQK